MFKLFVTFSFLLSYSLQAQQHKLYLISSNDLKAISDVNIQGDDLNFSSFDQDGAYYRIECSNYPCELTLIHIGYQEHVIQVAKNDNEKTVRLHEKIERFKKIVVSAQRDPFLSQAPQSVAADNKTLEQAAIEPASLLSLIGDMTGVVANGQGGLFQTFSIRGVAKHRIKTMVDGIPISSMRRAGVSASFIDPLLLESVDVVRGPVSTFYGSGALGGIVNMHPLKTKDDKFSAGYQTEGNANYLMFAKALESSSFALSRRKSKNGESANGETLNDHYEQWNGLLEKQWQSSGTDYSIWLLQSEARDIGKSNLRFPNERITNYPEESHTLIKLNAHLDNGDNWGIFAHDNALKTYTLRPNSRENLTNNTSFDYGGQWQRKHEFKADSLLWGIDWFSRRNVDASEVERRFSNNSETHEQIMSDGQLDNIGMFVSHYSQQEGVLWHLGARANWQGQSVDNGPSVSESAASGFVGADWQLSENSQGLLNIATGFRFPTLSERFFTGSTGRGEVEAVAGLKKEKSSNIDLGWQWQKDQQMIAVRGFQMWVDDYIERVSLPDDTTTYQNLTTGIIKGVEIEHEVRHESFSFKWDYSRILGRSDSGQQLSDIPSDRITAQFQWFFDSGSIKSNWQHRRFKSDVGDGELALASVDLLSIKADYTLNDRWRLSIFMNNALDKQYKASADDLETWAAGRFVGVNISWTRF